MNDMTEEYVSEFRGKRFEITPEGCAWLFQNICFDVSAPDMLTLKCEGRVIASFPRDTVTRRDIMNAVGNVHSNSGGE